MADSEQDKSERPTPFKLQKARENGQVARGMDLGFFAGLAAVLGCLWAGGDGMAMTTAKASRDVILSSSGLGEGPGAIIFSVPPLAYALAPTLIMVIGTIFGTALLFGVLQNGISFSVHPLKPDFSRINPASGIKRLFSWRLLIETFKNVLKIALYGLVVYLIVDHSLRNDVGSIRDASTLLSLMNRLSLRVLAAFAGVALLFAIVDLIIVRRDFLKKMGMSRREVRREAREREGDPRLKQRRKQLHAELLKRNQSTHNLKGADVLIANPEHIALALRYERHVMSAPTIVSLGIDHQALHLKHLALLYGIPIVEDRALARALYSRSALNRQIPEHCFTAVADIYNKLWRQVEREAPQDV